MRHNLVLVVWHDDPKTWADLHRIAARVRHHDRSIRTAVVAHHTSDQIKLVPLWFRPTLSLSMPYIPKRKLLPGRFLSGFRIHKHGEYRRLEAASIPVPQWTAISPDTQLDPAEWGPYVIEKPSAGRLGAYVRIRRTNRVRYQPPESLPPEHHGRLAPMLAQRFIYTGPWPQSYRVITLFGEVLLAYRQMSTHGQPLTGRWDFGSGGVAVVSNTKTMTIALIQEADVIALAERAHREAFRDFPVLAFDIVRDYETGELFVLECHCGGTWLFSAEMGLSIQASNNIDFESQFDALDKTARILAREVPRLAEVSPPKRDDRAARLGGLGD